MALVPIKHVYIVKRKLATGIVAEYHYAWRGGPRIQGEPGSKTYLASLREIHETQKQPKSGTLADLIADFKASPEFLGLGDHTKRDYIRQLERIRDQFGDMPLKALDIPGVRRHFFAWRDSMRSTPRAADMAVGVLKRILNWAVERAYIATNQAEPIGRLHSADKSDNIWTEADFDALASEASTELMQAVKLAVHTGLRQSDLIRLSWNHIKADAISFRTSKRDREVLIPVTPDCRALLSTIKRCGPVVLYTAKTGTPWTADGLRASFGKACDRAGVKRTFHDLRRTAATNLLVQGVTAPHVALLMGWSETDVEAMKRKYVSRAEIVKEVLAITGKDR